MSEATGYAVGIVGKFEDQITPGLTRVIELMERASALTLEFGAALRSLSMSSTALAKGLDKAVLAASKFGDGSGLAAASARLDTMAAASADIARNMEAARAAGAGVGGPAGRYPQGSGGGSGGGGYKSKAAVQAVEATGVAVLGGVYENARLDDTNVKAIATSQVPFDEWQQTMEKLRKKEFEYAHNYAFATGGRIEPFGEAILNSSRLLRTMPDGKAEQMTDIAMPYAALESKLKNIPLPEAFESFIELAHQAGAYSEKEASPLFGAMVQASLTTNASLDKIAGAASYALPSLHAAGANASDVMLLIATMQQGGIMNTKSGTWLNAMAMNALPNTLGSGLFKNELQNKALHDLGLYKGNQSQFYRNGDLDLMKEVAILSEARQKMSAEKFNTELRLAFGTQGQRAASFFSEQTTLDNLRALSALKDKEQAPLMVEDMIKKMSTVAKADQIIADANITLMNASATFTGPVNWLFDKTSNATKATADFTAENPGMGLAGIAGTALAGIISGKLLWKGTSTLITKLEGAIVRGLSSLMGAALRGATSLLASGALMTAIEVGAAIALGAVIGYVVGNIINSAAEYAIKKITGKEGTIGTALFDLFDSSKGLNEQTRDGVAKYRKEHNLPPVPVPPAQKPTADASKSTQEKTKDQAAANHVHVYVDGKEIAAHIVSGASMGTTDMNPSSVRLAPSGSSYAL